MLLHKINNARPSHPPASAQMASRRQRQSATSVYISPSSAARCRTLGSSAPQHSARSQAPSTPPRAKPSTACFRWPPAVTSLPLTLSLPPLLSLLPPALSVVQGGGPWTAGAAEAGGAAGSAPPSVGRPVGQQTGHHERFLRRRLSLASAQQCPSRQPSAAQPRLSQAFPENNGWLAGWLHPVSIPRLTLLALCWLGGAPSRPLQPPAPPLQEGCCQAGVKKGTAAQGQILHHCLQVGGACLHRVNGGWVGGFQVSLQQGTGARYCTTASRLAGPTSRRERLGVKCQVTHTTRAAQQGRLQAKQPEALEARGPGWSKKEAAGQLHTKSTNQLVCPSPASRWVSDIHLKKLAHEILGDGHREVQVEHAVPPA